MHDAGWKHPLAAAGAGLISWFQVGASEVAGDRPLPVRPFLCCAQDATAQTGTLDLSAIQVLLPVQGLDPASRPPYAPVPAVRTVDWFAERDPRSRTPVEININSGRNPSIPAVAQQLTDYLGRLEQDVFVCGSHDVAGRDTVLPPPITDSSWNGPPLHGVVLRGELAEWSCDAIGWLAEAIADSAAQLGVRSPLLLTVTRALPTGRRTIGAVDDAMTHASRVRCPSLRRRSCARRQPAGRIRRRPVPTTATNDFRVTFVGFAVIGVTRSAGPPGPWAE